MGRRLAAISVAARLLVGGASPACDARSGTCVLPEEDVTSLLQRPSKDSAPSSLETEKKPKKFSFPDFFTPTTLTPPPGAGIVDAVYTYGAPGSASPPLADNAHGGSFPGIRAYTEDIWGAARESKHIDGAAIFNTLDHARMPTLVLHWNEPSYYMPGAGRTDWPMPGGAVYAHWPLHKEDIYRDRLKAVKLDGTDPKKIPEIDRSGFFARLAWKAYDSTANTKQALQEDFRGWKMVADEVLATGSGSLYDEDPVRLYQHQTTFECALAFTGTNAMGSEPTTSTKTDKSQYCGIFGVHTGYRDELWHMTANLWPLLRPKLARCSKVNVLGHSLGGSVAEIFAACANSGHMEDKDYKQQAWVKEEPARIPETVGDRHVVNNALGR